MEVTAGFWLVPTRCSMTKGTLFVGMLLPPISKTANKLKKGCNRKTSLCARKLTRHRCLRRSLESRPLYKRYSRVFPRSHQVTPRFSYRVRREPAKSLLPAPSTDDHIVPHGPSS